MDDSIFNVRYWKYCAKCGRELLRTFNKSLPDRYDKISGEKFYKVLVRCPIRQLIGNENHTADSFETNDIENVTPEADELPF